MPGPEHGAVDLGFMAELMAWWRSNATARDYLAGGISSGVRFQPDCRLFPKKIFRDADGPDNDRDNKENAISRFIWEIEMNNRDPVQLHERGRLYMRNKYTRLFLAAKFYPLSEEDGTYEAAVVLWGKVTDNSDETTVVQAVSFGTADLSDKHKEAFSQHRANRLVGVQAGDWERPQQAAAAAATAAAAWTVRIPFHGIFYKVMKKKRKRGGYVYVLDDLETDVLAEDLTIDLRELARAYEEQVAPQELPVESDSDNDDE